jgi:hypothetical protein
VDCLTHLLICCITQVAPEARAYTTSCAVQVDGLHMWLHMLARRARGTPVVVCPLVWCAEAGEGARQQLERLISLVRLVLVGVQAQRKLWGGGGRGG